MRVSAFTKTLLNFLRMHLGEDKVFFFNNDFAQEDSINAVLKNSPVVFIDFIKDSFDMYSFSKLCTFEIYIIHAEPSVNASNRESAFYKQLDFVEELDGLLQELKFNHAGAITPRELKKEYGEITKNGFLTIYKRTFEVLIYLENPYTGE